MVDKSGKTPLGELSAYERWELPTLNNPDSSNRPHSAVVKKPIKPLTAGDIEKIRQQASSAGFEEGKTAGHEQGRQEGFEVGKQAGHKEGVQKGLIAGQAQIDQQSAQLSSLVSQIVDPINEQQKQVEQATLNIALALARTVIHRELKLDSSSIQSALSHIYQSLPKMDQGVVLSVNPTDESFLKASLESIDNNIELKHDASIMAGGFILETSSQLIDYTIEKRFQKAVHSMLLNAVQSENDTSHLETSSTIKELSDYPAELLDKVDEAEGKKAELEKIELDQSDLDEHSSDQSGELDE